MYNTMIQEPLLLYDSISIVYLSCGLGTWC